MYAAESFETISTLDFQRSLLRLTTAAHEGVTTGNWVAERENCERTVDELEKLVALTRG